MQSMNYENVKGKNSRGIHKQLSLKSPSPSKNQLMHTKTTPHMQPKSQEQHKNLNYQSCAQQTRSKNPAATSARTLQEFQETEEIEREEVTSPFDEVL